MMRLLINRCIEHIDSTSGLTKHHHSRLDGEANHIMGCEVLLDCDSPLKDMTEPLEKQKIAKKWRWRRERSVELALTMRLIKSDTLPAALDGKNFYTPKYSTTRLAQAYYQVPAFFQSFFIGIFLAIHSISAAASRFKWVTGAVSFGVLALKVWHLGLINNWWIAVSAAIGLAIGFITTLFH